MSGTKLEHWEKALRQILNQIDTELEEKYSGSWPRHPARPRRGSTANPKQDGLFAIGATYSAGFGSKLGEGYVVEIRLATLAKVPLKQQKQIEEEAITRLTQLLPEAFPKRELRVQRDGTVYKIIGDLSL